MESGVRPDETIETADRERRASEKKQGKRVLDHDAHTQKAIAFGAGARAASRVAQRVVDIRAGGLQRRRRAER